MKRISSKIFMGVMTFFFILSTFSGITAANVLMDTETVLIASAQEAVMLTQKDPRDELLSAGETLGQKVKKEDIRDIRYPIIGIVRRVLEFVGIILTIMILYAGFLWWSARGNDEQVSRAKSTLANSLIGMVIITMSYAIVSFVFRNVI